MRYGFEKTHSKFATKRNIQALVCMHCIIWMLSIIKVLKTDICESLKASVSSLLIQSGAALKNKFWSINLNSTLKRLLSLIYFFIKNVCIAQGINKLLLLVLKEAPFLNMFISLISPVGFQQILLLLESEFQLWMTLWSNWLIKFLLKFYYISVSVSWMRWQKGRKKEAT